MGLGMERCRNRELPPINHAKPGFGLLGNALLAGSPERALTRNACQMAGPAPGGYPSSTTSPRSIRTTRVARFLMKSFSWLTIIMDAGGGP